VCEDAWKNFACVKTIGATESDDGVAPTITRMYDSSGKLHIATNKEAQCYYSTEDCSFSLTSSHEMDTPGGDMSRMHTAVWNNKNTYYIVCEDGLWCKTQRMQHDCSPCRGNKITL